MVKKLAEKHPVLQISDSKIPNCKHQITNKSQSPIFNDQNNGSKDSGHFDFTIIDEKIFFNSLASCLKLRASSAFFRLLVS